jgi:His/Glu/Gln/Arg/opine family amino acid ABC transporter permease subunit
MTALDPRSAPPRHAPQSPLSRVRARLGFRSRVYLTWAALLGACALFFMSFNLKLSIILDKLPNLLGVHLGPDGFVQGAALTFFLCFCSIWLSLILGFVTALARLSNSAVAFGIASFYASFFRGTPLLIQILLIYLGLPQLGIVIVPPATSQFISMLKDSSLVSVMGVWEVMFLAQSYGRSSYRYIEMLTTAAVIYWLLSIGLELIQQRLERHFGKGFKSQR